MTGLSLVPTFTGGGGGGGDDGSQPGPSHENVEMIPMGSQQINNNACKWCTQCQIFVNCIIP